MRLLIVVNVDWFFISHRLPIAIAAERAGYEVHVATTITEHRSLLDSYGFIVHPIVVDRGNSNPINNLKLLGTLLGLFWRVRPDVLHLVTIKAVLLGGVAARLAPVGGLVAAISGLGHVFVAEGLFASLRARSVKWVYRAALGFRNSFIVFQNRDDKNLLLSSAKRTHYRSEIIPGSGVDLSWFTATPLPSGTPVVLMVSRLLFSKGVREFVTVAERLRRSGVRARFWLVGDIDPSNPGSIGPEEIEVWRQRDYVELLGFRSDMPQLMAQSHVVVLPSYREGFPKVLIEAAASGRAVITTDVPGCRDAIAPGETGVLVPAKSVDELALEIERLVSDRDRCEAMGREGRRRAERLFSIESVVAKHLEIYQTVFENR